MLPVVLLVRRHELLNAIIENKNANAGRVHADLAIKTDARRKIAHTMDPPLVFSTYVTMTNVMTALADWQVNALTQRRRTQPAAISS